jgi:hypothetical protein
MFEFPPFRVLAPIEILFALPMAPNPARCPRNTEFVTFDVDPPAPVPTNVSLELLELTRTEYSFPAPTPTYTFDLESPIFAAYAVTVFAETVSTFVNSSLVR